MSQCQLGADYCLVSGLLILGLEWLQLRRQGDGAFDIVIQPALWGTVATLVAIGSGAIFDLVRGGRRQRPLPYASHPLQTTTAVATPIHPLPLPTNTASAGDSSHTILDEAAFQGSNYANETILDDDMFEPQDVGSETIIDDEFMGGSPDHTMRGDDRTSYDAAPPTVTPEDLPQPLTRQRRLKR